MGDEAHDGAGGKGMSRMTITVGEAAETFFVAEPDRRACRRRPVAGSGPRSTTNDQTLLFRCTEPFALGTTVEPGCHGP
jgi:hypothetical protein